MVPSVRRCNTNDCSFHNLAVAEGATRITEGHDFDHFAVRIAMDADNKGSLSNKCAVTKLSVECHCSSSSTLSSMNGISISELYNVIVGSRSRDGSDGPSVGSRWPVSYQGWKEKQPCSFASSTIDIMRGVRM